MYEPKKMVLTWIWNFHPLRPTPSEKGKISQDVILMLDEMYIEKCEEYDSGKLIGADDENQLYKGVVSFMVYGWSEGDCVICGQVRARS